MKKPTSFRGSPLRWYGGKASYLPFIRHWMPSHTTFVDLFGGGGSVILGKRPSWREVYNDLDGEVVNFFRVLKSDAPALQRRLLELPPTLENFNRAYYAQHEGDELNRAANFYIVKRASFSGEGVGLKRPSYGFLGRFAAKKFATYWSKVQQLPAYAERLAEVIIDNNDFGVALGRYDAPDTLFYADPPYPLGMRSVRGQVAYNFELSDADHERLLKTLRAAQGMVMLSSYARNFYTNARNDLYLDMLRDWSMVALPTHARAARWNKMGKDFYREEVLWLNQNARARLAEGGSDLLREKLAA